MSQTQLPDASRTPTGQPVAYAVAPPRGLSITSLVLGIASFFFGFVFFVPIVGIVLGVMARRREPAGRGMALAGIWINAVILAGWAIVTVIIIAIAAAGLLSIPFWMNL